MTRIRVVLLPALLFLIAFVASLNFACGSESSAVPREVQLSDSDNDSTVRLAKGGELIVALESNASTGFSWSVDEASTTGLVLSAEPRYMPPGPTSPVAGAPGMQVFTFRAGDPGTAHLLLVYRRPFETGGPPAKTFHVIVEVR